MIIDLVFTKAALKKNDILSLYRSEFDLNDSPNLDDHRYSLLSAIDKIRSAIEFKHNTLEQMNEEKTLEPPKQKTVMLNAFLELSTFKDIKTEEKLQKMDLLIDVTAEREVLMDLLREYMNTFGDLN